MDADDIQPGGLVLFRWMQNLIDLCTEPPASPEQTSLSGGQIYPGEKLTDYAPRTPQAAAPTGPAVGTPEADALIDDSANDLPF